MKSIEYSTLLANSTAVSDHKRTADQSHKNQSKVKGERMSAGTFSLKTNSHMELVDITDTVQSVLREQNFTSGYCYLFNPHTTAGLTINEGADPDVKRDIIEALRNIVPLNFNYRHREGNSPSHVMASLMGSSLTVAVENGRLKIGTWQHLFFCEFDGPRTRSVHWRLEDQLHP